MRDDQGRVGIAVDERPQAVCDRRQSSAAVDQDRHPALRREREDRAEPLVGRREALGAGVQLDPACAGIEAARCLLERRLVQIEPDERDQPSLAALGEGKRPVVRGAEARVPVGLVEAEHERARDPVLGHQRLELVVVADHPVDVMSEVEMDVEDVGACRQKPLELRLPLFEELKRPGSRVHFADPS